MLSLLLFVVLVDVVVVVVLLLVIIKPLKASRNDFQLMDGAGNSMRFEVCNSGLSSMWQTYIKSATAHSDSSCIIFYVCCLNIFKQWRIKGGS